ncbi:hypothetical protein [Myroides odoratus]|uniref:hypothetical protein n=1 Tax=Myroides odoratus TaxID=256 RepID=UPI0009D9F143|nr:hypothetical protein [Myroides odoratus]
MKRLFMLFTMLLCFSIAGICKTTIDLSENSKQKVELVSFSDVVKVDAVFASADLKAYVGRQYVLVPRIFPDKKHIYTYSKSLNLGTSASKVDICIRDKIRIT